LRRLHHQFNAEEIKLITRDQPELFWSLRRTRRDARADGAPLQPQSLTHQFTRLVSRITDLPRVRFHDLRHSHATQLLLAGVHPKVAQERLGHASMS
jgi:integrase